MKKISKEQKKILYVSAIVFIFIIFFGFFIYIPQSAKFISIQKKLAQTESQIEEITRMTAGEDFVQVVKKLEINFNKFLSQFPKGEEEVIHNLSEEARKLKIKVKNIAPSGSKLLEHRVGGLSVEELSISISLVCGYSQFGEYLNTLRNNFPVLIKVRKLGIEGKGEGNPDLEINLQIMAYISKEN